jgi:hypothetical protein
LAEYQWANGIFTMSVIFIFASYDLSAALTELGVAVRLCDGHGRNEDCPSHPKQINIIFNCCDAHSTSELGQKLLLPQCNSNGGFTSVSGLRVGAVG